MGKGRRWAAAVAGVGMAVGVGVPVVGLELASGAAYPAGATTAVVGIASTPSHGGWWLAGEDGGVFTSGDAGFYGSADPEHPAAPVVGIAATPTGRGYWLAGRDGGVFAFGDAGFFGSAAGQRIDAPVAGMAATPTGRDYWLVGQDGGVFAFGDAGFFGSAAGMHLSAPIAGIAATPTGRGYWLMARDGGVFTYGDAPFEGSAAGLGPMGGVAPAGPSGYLLAAGSGQVYSYPADRARTAAVSGDYSVMATGPDGTPVRWDPCQAVHYVLNDSEAPAGADAMVQAAISEVGRATGVQFVYDGTTSELPASSRPAFQPTRYGDRWAPVLVAWEHAGQTDYVGSGELGMGGSTYLTDSGHGVYVTGQVGLNADQRLAPGATYPSGWAPVLAHELGHVMGLGHVSDPSQVMAPQFGAQSPDSYASGDRAGLAALGAGAGCLPEPTPGT